MLHFMISLLTLAPAVNLIVLLQAYKHQLEAGVHVPCPLRCFAYMAPALSTWHQLFAHS